MSEELKTALSAFVRKRVKATIEPVSVLAVDEDNYTCDVQDAQGMAIYDVRLRAALDGTEGGVVVLPKVGAQAIVARIGDSEAAWVLLSCTQASRILVWGDAVQLAGPDGEPLVLGDTLNDNLKGLNDNLRSVIDALASLASTQAAVSVGPLAPLAAGWAQLVADAAAVEAAAIDWLTVLPDHLSETVTTT